MKKRIVFILCAVAMLTCLFAISVSAYTPATSYNYYNGSVADENLLYSATTQMDPSRGRFEMTVTETTNQFTKFDADGNALTWYVVEESTDANGARNFICKAVKTLGEAGTVDAGGLYTYGAGTETGVTAKNVVSVCFYGTGVKSLPNEVYMVSTAVNPPHATEHTVLANGSNLLFLYLPKTLTAFPARMCLRSPVRVIEFEDNRVDCKEIKGVESVANGSSPFAFCANLKAISIPEGIETISPTVFRENCSLEYVKFPSTMTRLEKNVFFRCNNLRTVVLGVNMTYASTFSINYTTMSKQGVNMKYIYVPNTVNTAGSTFDSYRGESNGMLNKECNIVFFFAGTLEEANAVGQYTDKHFRNAIGNKSITYEEYIAKKEIYDNYNGHILVYNVPSCVAFYDGVHISTDEIVYKDAITPVQRVSGCTRCGDIVIEEYNAMLEALGYSAQINGDKICLGFRVNSEIVEMFPEVSYGILATVPGDGADMNAYEPLNPDLTPAVSNAVVSLAIEKNVAAFDLIVKSFSKNEAYYTTPIVICAYVTDGEKVDYICFNELDEFVQSEYAAAVTFEKIVYECAPKYKVTFTADDEQMGEVMGEASQVVMEGNSSSAVTAVAKDGYQFVCWSDGKKFKTTQTIEVSPEKNTDMVAYFAPASTGLPVMTINTENGYDIVTKDYYINCEISILDTETGNSIGGAVAEIKGRGNSTWNKFDKKPYKFKFDKKQDLFGYGNEKTWVLLADARDYSLVRNMLAFDAALTMSELGYTSNGQHVELYVNGEYRGVYYLCEQIQIKENRVNITQEDEELVQGPEDLGYLIEMDAWISEDCGGTSSVPNTGITSDGDVFVRVDDGMYNGYTIKDPEDVFFDADGNFDATKAAPYLEYIQTYIKNSMAAVSGNDYAAVCELIDVKSFAQAYIIYDLFKNPDTNYSSVYFYKDVDGKLVCSPVWDFDMAVGNVTHKANSGSNAQNFRDTSFLWTAQKNTWFRELLEFSEFRALVGQELVDNADTLRASIASGLAYARAHVDAYEKNFEVWNLIGNTSATEKMGAWSVPAEFKAFETYEEHLDYIETYLEASLQSLMSTYPAPAAE